jgi:hypothetical protein
MNTCKVDYKVYPEYKKVENFVHVRQIIEALTLSHRRNITEDNIDDGRINKKIEKKIVYTINKWKNSNDEYLLNDVEILKNFVSSHPTFKHVEYLNKILF